ncbi:MAG: hypothetical protein JJU00_12675 [Opitutales bacterium]|nr:hypothetical protein [Opitutales bacterium]
MGCVFRLFLTLFAACLAVVILIFGGAWLIGQYAPAQAARYVEKRTGYATEVGSVRANPFDGSLRVTGVRIANAPEFAEGDLLVLDELFVDFDVSGLRTRERRFSAVRVSIDRLGYVEREDGASNWDEFLEQLTVRVEEEPGDGVAERGEAARPYHIDKLYMRVGEVVIYPEPGERRSAREPRVIRVDKVVEAENVTDLPAELEAFAEELRAAGAPGPLRFLRGLRLMLSEVPEEGARTFEGLREALGDLVPGVGESGDGEPAE